MRISITLSLTHPPQRHHHLFFVAVCVFYTAVFIFILTCIHWCIYLFIFGSAGYSLLHSGFLYLRRVGLLSTCGAQVSCCNAIRTRALGARALVVAAQCFYQFGSWALGGAGFRSCGSQVLEHGLSSYGTSACSRHVESSQTRDRTVSSALAGRFCV